MSNEKGFTLIEVMASVLILTVLAGVGTALFYSVNSLWTRSTDQGSFDSMTNLTTNTISRELSDANELYVEASNKIRFKKYDGSYEMLEYDSASKSLDLYHITGATDITNGTASKYMNLSTKVSLFSVQDSSGSTLSVSSHLQNGNVVKFAITFDYESKNGLVAISKSKPFTVSVKLFHN